ncbi:MAG: GTPase ObgE [Oscillatoriales cyanobacterium SM2_1_8]|nr:GTPase ObgE [Oscillatoriales cyanobacterium SM2_1_8]
MKFIDLVEIQACGGHGGDGIVAFRREKYVPAGGPSGGNGGPGGSVILEATEDLQTLLDFAYERIFRADHGKRGGPNNRTGAQGSDRLVKVPCGTAVFDVLTGELLGDLTHSGQQLVVAKGGKGGLGNQHFLSNRNRAPDRALPGLPGEETSLRLELRLLAEVGIIGLPNAGKSTLISVLSSARPKVADYPFTTLVPNLGVVAKPTGDGVVFADIPGLIAGAHQGLGLGHEFLRHIQRTRVLIHLVDATQEDPLAAYRTIRHELIAYGQGLPEKPEILVLNKSDAIAPELLQPWVESLAEAAHQTPHVISAVARQGLETLQQSVWDSLETLSRELALDNFTEDASM